jgi:hypothetical protein
MQNYEEVKISIVSLDNHDIVRTSTVEDNYDWLEGFND